METWRLKQRQQETNKQTKNTKDTGNIMARRCGNKEQENVTFEPGKEKTKKLGDENQGKVELGNKNT